MLALKAVAEKQSKPKGTKQQAAIGLSHAETSSAAAQDAANRASRVDDQGDQPSCSSAVLVGVQQGAAAAVPANPNSHSIHSSSAAAKQPQRQATEQQNTAADIPSTSTSRGPRPSNRPDLLLPFQEEPKTLKQRKKDYLKQKQNKKKRKGLVDEGDLESKLLQQDKRPKFGEQVHAPLQINLKRKHWKESQVSPSLQLQFAARIRACTCSLFCYHNGVTTTAPLLVLAPFFCLS